MTMPTPVTHGETATAVVCDIADHFEHSWNTADSTAYAEPFALDADYLTIQGQHIRGRHDIAAGAAEIFATIYRDSTIALQVHDVRCLAPTVIVAQVEHVLSVPAGPLAGTATTIATMVVVDTVEGWEVSTFHNTLIVPSVES